MLIKEWDKKTLLSKILTIIGFIISIIVIILAILQIFNVWENSIYVFEPLTGVLMLIQAIEHWKKDKRTAYISLFASIFLIAVAIFIFLVKL